MITFDAVPDRDRLAAALRSSMSPLLVVQVPAAVLGLVGAFGLLTGARAWPLTLLVLGALAYWLVPELLAAVRPPHLLADRRDRGAPEHRADRLAGPLGGGHPRPGPAGG